MKFATVAAVLFAAAPSVHASATERPSVEVASISWRFGGAEDQAINFSLAGIPAISSRSGTPAGHYSCAPPGCTWQSNLMAFSLYSLGTWAMVELYEDAK